MIYGTRALKDAVGDLLFEARPPQAPAVGVLLLPPACQWLFKASYSYTSTLRPHTLAAQGLMH
jgi:hypothetical protein